MLDTAQLTDIFRFSARRQLLLGIYLPLHQIRHRFPVLGSSPPKCPCSSSSRAAHSSNSSSNSKDAHSSSSSSSVSKAPAPFLLQMRTLSALEAVQAPHSSPLPRLLPPCRVPQALQRRLPSQALVSMHRFCLPAASVPSASAHQPLGP